MTEPNADSDHERDRRAVIAAATTGDASTLRHLLERDPTLVRGRHDTPQPLPFAVREGHLEAVRVLLDAGAQPDHINGWGDTLVETARDRGFEDIARLVEEARQRSARIKPSETHTDHPIHLAAEAGDLKQVRALLDAGVRGYPARRRSQHLREGRGVPLDSARVGGAQQLARHGRVPPRPRSAHQSRERQTVGHADGVGRTPWTHTDRINPTEAWSHSIAGASRCARSSSRHHYIGNHGDDRVRPRVNDDEIAASEVPAVVGRESGEL